LEWTGFSGTSNRNVKLSCGERCRSRMTLRIWSSTRRL
jgi:hypothetical protein